MNVREIVKQYLESNNFDGLYTENCGCETTDLFPCEQDGGLCQPGYRYDCECSDDCGFHIGPRPESEDCDEKETNTNTNRNCC